MADLLSAPEHVKVRISRGMERFKLKKHPGGPYQGYIKYMQLHIHIQMPGEIRQFDE